MRPRSDTLAWLAERSGPELVARLEHLDAVRGSKRNDRHLVPPDRDASVDVDVVFAGGGLSLLVAAELARHGVSVAVLERARAGHAHREWNASEEELAPLVSTGIFSAEECARFVVARYREGLCAFHRGAPRRVRGVLDCAVDAGPMLSHVRAVAAARGVRFLDEASVVAVGAGRSSVRVGFERPGEVGELVARVLVDARGSSSPSATADLVCPTVGGVFRGLRRGSDSRAVDPMVGEILVTTEGAVDGRQHIWEGFPGRDGEITVYLFYYALAGDVPPDALAKLYERLFAQFGSYKDGEPELVRPTFGYIPGWSRLALAPSPPSSRIALVGDAAARHSPLTFCGFGSMLRSFVPAAEAIARAVAEREAPPRNIVPEEPVHAWTGALARVMASGVLEGDKLNVLLDAAFGVLEDMGNDAFADLLKDRMRGPAFTDFLLRTARRRPVVYSDVLRALGPLASLRWGARLAREVLS